MEAPSAEAAIVMLGTGPEVPALIIADYELAGGKTGIEGIAALRTACKRAVPAFLISAVVGRDRLQAAGSAGLSRGFSGQRESAGCRWR